MMKAHTESTRRARVIATAFEIFCPDPACDREEAIPYENGSFFWTFKPLSVTCPDCGKTFKTATRIEA